MAQLGTFATTAANVTFDSGTLTYTIQNEVVEIDGTLDAPTGWDDWGGFTIVCTSSGGLRSVAGATGTLGGGRQSLTIIETNTGHRFGGDNFQNTSARFSGGTTNTLKYHNVRWIVQPGNRSDFDFYRGTTSNGTGGTAVELSGVYLIQQKQSGIASNFNHYGSQNVKIRIHPQVGFGLRIRNETTGHAFEFSNPIGSSGIVEGLVIDNVTDAANQAAASNARVTARLEGVSTNGTLTLSNLNSPSITDVNGGTNSGSKTLVLVDPVGKPTITNNWGRHVQLEIRRTVPFTFTGDPVPAGSTMRAIAQNASGVDASATMGGTTGSVQVRTQFASSTSTSWTDRNTYKFYMTATGMRKYALTTTQTIGDTPTAISAAITADALPNGAAISTITVPSDECDTTGEILAVVKKWEVDNPTLEPDDAIVHVDGSKIKFNDDYDVILDSTASELIDVDDTNEEITIKCNSSLTASNGLYTLDATGTGKTISTTSVTEASDIFLLDSTGQKSVIGITNHIGSNAVFSLIQTSTGLSLGSHSIISSAFGGITVNTKGLTSGYRLVAKRPGWTPFVQDIDLTGGGLQEITARPTSQIVQPSGVASYISTITVPSTLTVALSSTGTTPSSRIECGNATFSAAQIFKASEDALAAAGGAHFIALLGQQVTYSISELKGNEIVLGAHTKIKRKASGDSNATVRATLYAPDAVPIDDSNGDVQTIEGLDIPAVAKAIITSTDFNPTETGTQSVWGQLTAIKTAVDDIEGGAGGGASAQDVWEYSGTRSLSTAPPTASAVASTVWGAATRTLTTSAAPTAAAIADAVWSENIDDTVKGPIDMTLSYLDGPALIPTDAGVARIPDIETGDPIVFTARSTFSFPNLNTTYYARTQGSNKILFYEDRDDALGGVDPLSFVGTGNQSHVRFTLTESNPIGTTDYFLKSIRESVEAIDPPTTSEIASAVWSTDLDPNLNGVQDIRTAIRKLNTLTTSAIAAAVWSSDAALTESELVDAIWAKVIDGGIVADLTVIPTAKAGDGFRISTGDADLISTGDAFTFTDTGGYSGLVTGQTYYAFVGSGVLYVYDSRHDALTPGSSWHRPSGGTIGDVRMVFPGAKPIGTAGVVLHRLLTAVASLENDSDLHSLATGAIGTQMNNLMGTGFVEAGLSLQGAMRMAIAVLAGKMTKTGDTIKFHRRDSSETEILSMDVTLSGRSEST